MKHGRMADAFEGVVLGAKTEAPKSSWWITADRESFMDAAKRQEERMRTTTVSNADFNVIYKETRSTKLVPKGMA